MNSNHQPLFDKEVTGLHSVNLSPNQTEGLISIAELSKQLDESVHVLRNWIRDLRPHIPLYKNDFGHNLFNEEAVKILTTIKQLHRDKGFSMKEIEYYIVTNGKRKISVINVAKTNENNTEIEKNLDNQTLLTDLPEGIGVAIQSVLNEVVELRREVSMLRLERQDVEEFASDTSEANLTEPENRHSIYKEYRFKSEEEYPTLFTRRYISRYDRKRRRRWNNRLLILIRTWFQKLFIRNTNKVVSHSNILIENQIKKLDDVKNDHIDVPSLKLPEGDRQLIDKLTREMIGCSEDIQKDQE